MTVYDCWAIPQWGSNSPQGHVDVDEARADIPHHHRVGALGLTGLAISFATRPTWDVEADVHDNVDLYYRE